MFLFEIVNVIDPLKYVPSEKYSGVWNFLINNMLSGFMSRVFAVISLSLAFWFLLYRRNTSVSILFMVITIVIAYFGAVIKYLFTF